MRDDPTPPHEGRTRTTGVRPLLPFFLLSHGWTWAFWGVVAVQGWDIHGGWGLKLLLVGGLGPMLGGLVMSGVTGGRTALGELGLRLISLRRIGLRWLLVALLIPVLALVGAAALAAAAGTAGPLLDVSEARELLSNPVMLISAVLGSLLYGPLPEEIGWRGYLLDALQDRWNALTASLLLGAVWALWYLPFLWMAGGGSAQPVLFVATLFVSTILLTWIYNNSHRSVLAAVLFHLSLNLTGGLVDRGALVSWLATSIMAALALGVIIRWSDSATAPEFRMP